MLDPNAAVQNLYNTLVSKGMEPEEATEICRDAAIELNARIAHIVMSGLEEAYEIGAENEMTDFVNQLDIQRNSFGFNISAGGAETYERERLPMVPILTKGGKLSRKGSIYKVIPQFAEKPKKHVSLSSMDAMKSKSELIETARQALREKSKKIPDVMSIAQAMASTMSKPTLKVEDGFQTGTPVAYHTASTAKPDKWIRPAKKIDLSGDVKRINDTIASQIEGAVTEVLQSYGG